VFLRHCYLLALFSPYSPTASEVVSLLLVDSSTTALPYAWREWPIVTMILGLIRSDASSLLHHWLLEVEVQPFIFTPRIQQAFPKLFPVCAPPGSWHVLPVFYTLV